jgi:hypothetical protein
MMDPTRLPDATLLDALRRARRKLAAAEGLPEPWPRDLARLPEDIAVLEAEIARRGLQTP